MAEFLAILFMLAFVILLILADFRQRKSNQHPVDRRKTQLVCAYCGYDLEASRERCPECGRPILLHPDPELDLETMRKKGACRCRRTKETVGGRGVDHHSCGSIT